MRILMKRLSLKDAKPGTPPPWQVLLLVSSYLEPKTLAMASCVSRSWQSLMSSDDVWQNICYTLYPSLSNLKHTNPSVPYHRMYAMASSVARRRLKAPIKPRLSLDNLVFAINISALCPNKTNKSRPILNIAKPAREFALVHNEVLKLDIVNGNYEFPVSTFEGERVKVMWNIMLNDWKAVFTMMECEGKVNFDGCRWDGWFSQELPLPGCCSVADTSTSAGLVADVKLVLSSKEPSRISGGGTDIRISKLSLGMLNIRHWSYVSLDYGLRYLEHFLARDL
ncbi:hypothetical protein Tsubulata_007067 [Turnera subulata]|uniref:F-box protein n=1 Tax=Turnera subulata TaxID=218843 RepID=A0A9Q0JRQ7_9ROSI|nr:hypothetical protein Tsubulata_007067 [Turnera subulata]